MTPMENGHAETAQARIEGMEDACPTDSASQGGYQAAEATQGSASAEARWITIDVERALYVDRGREVILCDRLPSPATLVIKVRGDQIVEVQP